MCVFSPVPSVITAPFLDYSNLSISLDFTASFVNSLLGKSFVFTLLSVAHFCFPKKRNKHKPTFLPHSQALKDTRENRWMPILSWKPATECSLYTWLIKISGSFFQSRFKLQVCAIVPCAQRVDLMIALPGNIRPTSAPSARDTGEWRRWKGSASRLTTCLKRGIFQKAP